ncbi:MAG: hypothetical protein RIQ98_34 [Bacteroidota bacterium]
MDTNFMTKIRLHDNSNVKELLIIYYLIVNQRLNNIQTTKQKTSKMFT